MYAELVPFLRCRSCQQSLEAHPTRYADDGEYLAGALVCTRCSVCATIHQGIADFLGPPRPFSLTQVINEWPHTAWGYERLWRPFALSLFSGSRFPYHTELPIVVALARPWRAGLFVDVACSNGLYARALARTRQGAPGHVVGVDHALPMLLDARRRARRAGLRISYVRAVAQDLPFASSAAAGVTIGGSLNEIGDLDGCLAEVRRVLAPAERFVAMTLVRSEALPVRLLQTAVGPGGIRFWRPDELIDRFAAHGLRLCARWQRGIVLFTGCHNDRKPPP